MAPRQTARRLLVAVPALALALGVAACSPPNEQPADADAPYTLPTYTGEAEPGSAPETEGDPSDGSAEGLHGEATTPAEPTDEAQVPAEGEQQGGAPAAGQGEPTQPAQPAS